MPATVNAPWRANAKSNHYTVTILSDPEDYHEFLKELEIGDITEKSRQLYALKAFNHTAEYDEAISDFFRKKFAGDGVQQLSLRYVSKDNASQYRVRDRRTVGMEPIRTKSQPQHSSKMESYHSKCSVDHRVISTY